eukprot:CAMPEP_0172379918 /NCGR_PEP_ID=MMETSP1060-20121228/70176_1 /TAXON_ID=37318 /ORGANISM="Pseudo-nitzschia pungens, Strain cf. cingulata" /LENGTH=644 /DNA_ID=CAMNT_0013107663 /DNA_START=209 /DNA_END=2143 /DNA_ORIENTATION=+
MHNISSALALNIKNEHNEPKKRAIPTASQERLLSSDTIREAFHFYSQMFNNSNNQSGGNPSSSNTGIGPGDFGGPGGHGSGQIGGPGDDPMNSLYGDGNDMAAAARFGMGGGGSDMMGMNAMGSMGTMGGMSGMGSMGGMSSMGGMNSMGRMGVGNMPHNMSSRMENMDMIALYRAKEKMAMMNARRAAFLGSGEEKFGGMGMGMGMSSPSFGEDIPSVGGNVDPLIGIKRRSVSDDMKMTASVLKGKRRKKTKKPNDMPRRALSAYNIFFSEQREKILKEIDERDSSKKDKDDNEVGDKPSEGTEDKKRKIEEKESTDHEAKGKDESSEKDDISETKDHGGKVEKEGTKDGEEKEKNQDGDDKEQSGPKKATGEDEAKKTKDRIGAKEPKVMNRTFFPTRAKRAHRKVHGKIGLVDLAREVSRRWKALDAENRAHYESLAEEDRKRHKKVMAEYQERKAAENMLSMGGKGDDEERDGKAKDKSSDDPNEEPQTEQDIRETITHHHQQRILAEMMARRGDPLSGRGGNFGMMSNRFGGSMGNQGMGGMNDMQAILDLQNQRAMMMQRMRMSGGMGGMGGMGMDNMEGMGGMGGMGNSGMGGSGMGGHGMGGHGMGGPGMGGPGMGGPGMGGGMGGMGGGMGPSL